jgi:hypothetical protein
MAREQEQAELESLKDHNKQINNLLDWEKKVSEMYKRDWESDKKRHGQEIRDIEDKFYKVQAENNTEIRSLKIDLEEYEQLKRLLKNILT